jgi:hypothetical protein
MFGTMTVKVYYVRTPYMYDIMELALNLNWPCLVDKIFTIIVFPIEASLADDAVEVLW